jgi:hypothetical protein
MVALTEDRNTPEAIGDLREGAVGASALIFAGSIVMRNAAGFLIRGATATGSIAVGRAEQRVDNSAGANGAATLRYKAGTFRFANSASADAITFADIGKACWIVDDQTVARTSGANTRSRAGIVEMVDAQGVWVRFDEALTRVATTTAA